MRLARRLVPFALALAFIALLLWQIDPTQVIHLLAGADPRWLLVGLGFYMFANMLRSVRFSTLFRADYSPLRLLPEMFAVSLFNNILPSRSGELSFPYFMKTRHGMAVGQSTAALLVVRIFDYLAVALLYVVFSLLNLNQLPASATPVILTVAALLLISLLLLATMPWLGRQFLRLAERVMSRLGLAETRSGTVLLRVTRRAVEAFEGMRTPRTYGFTIGWSLLIWLVTFGWFWAFMRAMGLAQSYPQVIMGGTFAMLAKAIPLITVGGFGAHEAGWALGFRLVGMDLDVAIASGFAVNILTLAASLIFGGAALVFMRLQARHRDQGQELMPRSAERQMEKSRDTGALDQGEPIEVEVGEVEMKREAAVQVRHV